MNAARGMLRATLRWRSTGLVWGFAALTLALAVLMVVRSDGLLALGPAMLAGVSLAVASWLFGTRLWLLDREAGASGLPGRERALLIAAAVLLALLALFPAFLLALAGTPPIATVTVLLAAVLTGSLAALLPGPWLVAATIGALMLIRLLADGVSVAAVTLIAALLGLLALAGLVLRWRPLQTATADGSIHAPWVLSRAARETEVLGDGASLARWWQPDANRPAIALGEAGPRRRRQALAVLLGLPIARTRLSATLRAALPFMGTVLLIAVITGGRVRLLPMLLSGTLMISLIFATQCLLRVRHECRQGGALPAEARLLPGLEAGRGWSLLLATHAASQMRFGVTTSVLMAALLLVGSQAHDARLVLAALPLWAALLGSVLLPAVLARRVWLDAPVLVCMLGVLLLDVVGMVVLLARDSGAVPVVGLAAAGWLSLLALAVGAIGWLLVRRQSPFVER